MKSMTVKQKLMLKIGVQNLMDEILEDIESDQQFSTGLSATSTLCCMTSLQKVQNNSQSLVTYVEMD
jgi:hypothetical protein